MNETQSTVSKHTPFLASFPGLQYLIPYNMQIWRGGGLGDLVMCDDVR